MKQYLLFAIMVFAALSMFGQAVNIETLNKKEQDVYKSILSLNKQVFGNKDSSIIASLISPDVQYVHSGGNLENKSEMVHNAIHSKTVYKNAKTEINSVKIIGKIAIARHVLKATSVDKGGETPLELGVLQVWKKQQNKWQLIERQAVKLNVKKL